MRESQAKKLAVFGNKEETLIIVSKRRTTSYSATDDYYYALTCESPTGLWEVNYGERWMNAWKGQEPTQHHVGKNIAYLFGDAKLITPNELYESLKEQIEALEKFEELMKKPEEIKNQIRFQLRELALKGFLIPKVKAEPTMPCTSDTPSIYVYVEYCGEMLGNSYWPYRKDDGFGNLHLAGGDTRYNEILNPIAKKYWEENKEEVIKHFKDAYEKTQYNQSSTPVFNEAELLIAKKAGLPRKMLLKMAALYAQNENRHGKIHMYGAQEDRIDSLIITNPSPDKRTYKECPLCHKPRGGNNPLYACTCVEIE